MLARDMKRGSELETNFFVAGFNLPETRVGFGARTGGQAADHDLDNINVVFTPAAVPHPATLLSLLVGLGGVATFVRRRR